jgi:hypothetical protein
LVVKQPVELIATTYGFVAFCLCFSFLKNCVIQRTIFYFCKFIEVIKGMGEVGTGSLGVSLGVVEV